MTLNAPDLHPEELLDRSRTGRGDALTPAERALLDEHLAHCTVCRFEQQVQHDFREAPVAAALDLDNLVTRALSGMPTRQATRRPQRSAALVAAMVVGVVGVTSFAAVGVTRVWPKLVEAFAAPAPPIPEPPRAPVPSKPVAPAVQLPPPMVEVAVEPAPGPALPPVHAREAGGVHESSRLTPPPAEAPKVDPDAPALFSSATQARVRGDRAVAMGLYRDLLQRYPGSDEAMVSRATLGRLLLDSGDAQGALVELEAYLGSADSTLREEVLAAQAQACGRLGRERDEAAAWKQLLTAYPGSIHADHARGRLTELGQQ